MAIRPLSRLSKGKCGPKWNGSQDDCTLNQAVWYNDISEAVLIVGRNCKERAVVSAEIIGNVEAIFHVKASHGCCWDPTFWLMFDFEFDLFHSLMMWCISWRNKSRQSSHTERVLTCSRPHVAPVTEWHKYLSFIQGCHTGAPRGG